jgi:mannose-6-phosphate isomerase-like protein (cupin superfamily)
MVSSICLFLLATTAAPATAAVQAATTVDVLVTDRHGRPLQSAHVRVDGASDREGNTNATGHVVFRSMGTGAYKLRVERLAFITFEKEFTVRPKQGRASVAAALSPVLPVAPRGARSVHDPTASPMAYRSPSPNGSNGSSESQSVDRLLGSVGDAGTPQIVSIPDMAEKHLIGHSSVKESPIGCSGLTGARLIQVTEPLSDHTHSDAEEMLYVVAGEAALTIGQKTETVKSGWFSIIPRGVPYALIRTGRNPVILLSVVGSQPCGSTLTRAAADNELVARRP